ncbi:hypothetical protein GCM10027446_13800 [Angustibacter peucedani]
MLVVLAGLAWTGLEVLHAVQAARAARTAALAVQDDVTAKRWDAASAHAASLGRQVEVLRRATGSWPLRALAHVPVVKTDVVAVRATSDALSDVSTSLPPLIDAARQVDAADLVVDGKIDVDAIRALAGPAGRASDALQRASSQLHGIPTGSLHLGLGPQVTVLRSQVDELAAQAALASRTAARLPGLLGADGVRRYLLVDQNLAEARPTGGIFGAYAVLRADDGRLALEAAGVNDELGELDPSDLDVDAQARRLYGADLALSQNFNLSPNFPQAARLAAQLWQRKHDSVQGVLAVDPVLVQSLLSVTGPVDVSGGPRLTAKNAADVLMRQVYSTLGGNTSERNAYLVRSTGAVFKALLAGGGNSGELRRVLGQARDEGHLRAWSARPADQTFFRDAGLAGELGTPANGTVGLYFTNVDGSKLDYYLRAAVTTRQACSDQRAELQLDLTNTAPRDLPTYVRNQLEPAGSRASTSHVVLLSLYLPPGRGLASLTVGGSPRAVASDPESGWTLVRAAVSVPSGSTVRVEAQLDGVSSAPQVITQPMVRPVQQDVGRCSR